MKDSKIEWCDHTFNPWEGCTKVSPGCAHCYAEARNHRFGNDNWGKGKPRRRTAEGNWRKPIVWNREAVGGLDGPVPLTPALSPRERGKRRPRVFCASLADWLDEEVPIEWLKDLLELIYRTPNLDWLLLTKRPGNFEPRVRDVLDLCKLPRPDAFYLWARGWLKGEPPAGVWVGASVEDQARADERIPELLRIPARVRFLSVEPMLGAIDLGKFLVHHGGDCGWQGKPVRPFHSCVCAQRLFDWVIFGGESGARARRCEADWIREGVKQCRAAGVAPFVKQLGSLAFDWTPFRECHGELARLFLTDKKGGEISEWAEDLRVREFPQGKAKG